MQTTFDLICAECSNKFDSASLLLQHFASHEIKNLEKEATSLENDMSRKKSKMPNLYPINMVYDISINETDRGSDSGIEDVNPLKFCLVTMEDRQLLQSEELLNNNININHKKYQCKYCFKRFGWSTDLKRHTLIHTGERPFLCPDCDSSFTRNFLLQKHQKKVHCSGKANSMLPELRPISDVLKKKKRKQHKCLIKHNAAASEICINNNGTI